MAIQYTPYLFIFNPHCLDKNLTLNQVNYNNIVSQTRVSVERLFNEIETCFKFVLSKSLMKIGLSVVGKICALTIFCRDKISEFFQLDPLLLQDYFQ